jgi:hypothetical protein
MGNTLDRKLRWIRCQGLAIHPGTSTAWGTTYGVRIPYNTPPPARSAQRGLFEGRHLRRRIPWKDKRPRRHRAARAEPTGRRRSRDFQSVPRLGNGDRVIRSALSQWRSHSPLRICHPYSRSKVLSMSPVCTRSGAPPTGCEFHPICPSRLALLDGLFIGGTSGAEGPSFPPAVAAKRSGLKIM